MPKKMKRPRRNQRAGASEAGGAAGAAGAAAGAGGGAPEAGAAAEAAGSAVVVRTRQQRIQKQVKEHGNLVVYIIFAMTNISILIYAFIKNKDAPDYDDFKELKDDDAIVHKTKLDLLKVAGLCLMSGVTLLLHILITRLVDHKGAEGGPEKWIYYFSNACLGITSLGVFFNFFRYVINHVVAGVVGVLFFALLLYDAVSNLSDSGTG
jgi:hypothetical protein